MYELNEELIKSQKVTLEQRETLQELYKELEGIFDGANSVINIIAPAEYVEMLKELEFKLQDNWNFPRDGNFHVYWDKFNDCTCPHMDNAERFGFPKYISGDCPYHGNFNKTEGEL